MPNKKRFSESVQQLVFVGPATLFFLIIVVLPFFLCIYYGLTDWNGVERNARWVGLSNFQRIFTSDTGFMRSFWFTARYTFVTVILLNLIGFGLALLLTQALKLRNLMRTIFFIPNVIGGLLLGYIWQFIFVNGFVSIGNWTNIKFFQLPWLGTPATGFWALVIVTVWQYAGYLMIIYIASIISVPKEMIEAAKIDGANRWQVLKNITVPMIMPAFTVSLFLAISWCFKVFDVNLSLTGGGPFKSTESLALNIFIEAFTNNRYGLGSAKALIFFVVVATVTIIQVSITKKREVEA